MTKIEWTDETWNPIVGCSKISRGCTNCYAEKMAARFSWPEEFEPEGHIVTKLEGSFHRVIARSRWNGKTVFKADRLEQPLKFRKARRIFVCSMGDLFHASVERAWIDQVFAVMAIASMERLRCPRATCDHEECRAATGSRAVEPIHTFQILTKRPDRMLKYLVDKEVQSRISEKIKPLGYSELLEWAGYSWPLRNVWIGVSAEDQEAADDRIPLLLQTPAAVRFVSVEPMLGPVELERDWFEYDAEDHGDPGQMVKNRGIDWVICGGESGPRSRPMHPDWARSLRDQCADAGVRFFFKQWGEWEPRGSLRYTKARPLKGDLLFPGLDYVFR